MKTISRVFALLLIFCLLAASLPVFAASEPLTGKCGDNVFYSFDETTGTLTISGNGPMWDFREAYFDDWAYDPPQPWYEYRYKTILRIVIEDGVTRIGANAFYGCNKVTEVSFPQSLDSIGDFAFRLCSSLTQVVLPQSLRLIGNYAFVQIPVREFVVPEGVVSIGQFCFESCQALKKLTLPSTLASFDASMLNSNLRDVYYNGTLEQWNRLPAQYYDTDVFYKAQLHTTDATVPFRQFVPCPGSKFTDMPIKSNWAHDPIEWAIEHGITNGTSETTFSPGKGCTRAEAATFLWRAAGKPEPANATNPFADVSESAYYYQAVLWAVEKSITTGVSATAFAPDKLCTRGEIVTFLWRFHGRPSISQLETAFTDVKPGAYYESAAIWAGYYGIANGTEQNLFSPDSICIRAQIVAFLQRAEKITEANLRNWKEKRYEIVYDNCTWEEAQAAAAAKGGRLVTFDIGWKRSTEKLNVILSAIARENGMNTYFYLGARRDENKKTYRWVDERNRLSGEPLNGADSDTLWNDQWLPGEPSFTWKGKPETVVVMYLHPGEGRWVWDDVSADSFSPGRQYGYIIEYGEND